MSSAPTSRRSAGRRPAARAWLLAGLTALTAVAATGVAQGPVQAMGLPKPLPWSASRLTVAYDDGGGRTSTYHLFCGRDRDSQGCRRLEEIGGPAGPVDAGQMCSMIYGGPQSAVVTGTWAGQPVRETYRRTNGCEVARWTRMVPALPDPVAAGPDTDLKS